MASPLNITVKESIKELKSLLKHSTTMISPRLRMLIEIKKHDKEGISKRELASTIGVNHNSIQTWRKIYISGGIEKLCSHNKKGFKPSVFNNKEHEFLKNVLYDNLNGINGYKELLTLLENEFNKEFKYNTMLKYCIKNFQSSIKVARKSHIKKDEEAVNTFKKTSVKSVMKQSKSKKINIKK
jgi:transposase